MPSTRHLLSLAVLLGATLFHGAVPAFAEDAEGSKDHPLLTRFTGAEITAYQQVEYDEAVLPNQPIQDDNAAQTLTLEGKITRIAYSIKANKSALEITRNYQEALQKGGFETLFQCKSQECGERFDAYVLNGDKVRLAGQGDASFGDPYRAILAKKSLDSGDVYVFLDIMEDHANNMAHVFQEVVETKAMQSGQVSVLDAGKMQDALKTSGKVAIYGVYFDTDKAQIKPESKEALDQMAKLLADNPALKVYVVGHTDNQGQYEHNLQLSRQRAEAVAQVLATTYRIAPDRLSAHGVASLSPVAANDDDADRAKNRRVELVQQ